MTHPITFTGIVVGWTVNRGRRMGQLDDMPDLLACLGRVFERESCTLHPA